MKTIHDEGTPEMMEKIIEQDEKKQPASKIVHEVGDSEMISRIAEYGGKGKRPFHWHEKIEVIQCLDDSMSILIDGVLVQCKKGDIVVIRERSIHSFLIEHEKATCLLCQFPLKALLNRGGSIQPVKTHISVDEINEDPIFAEQISDLFRIIMREGKTEKGTQNIFLECMFAALYFALMRKFPAALQELPSKREQQEFYKVVNYINCHYKEDITVQGLSQEMYMSRGKLSGIFEKFSGMPLPDYVNALRINCANQLLESGISVTQTAYECGFSSTRTFNNVYKKIMGITPSEYMKEKKRGKDREMP